MEDLENRQPGMYAFVLLSVGIHAVAFFGQGLIPELPSTAKLANPPIEVSFVEPKIEAPGRNIVVDVPPPEVTETPNTHELLSNANSRAHSNVEKIKADEYSGNKTIVPKISGSDNPEKSLPVPEKKKSPPVVRKKELAETGIAELAPTPPEPEVQPAKPQEEKSPVLPKSAFALLDGFDAEKYASLDTKSQESADDSKPISLDTTETKYVSYFARIKHQIERVWTYPMEAAQRGISGELTLRFQISRDGNLVGIYMVDKSGYEILDLAALKAVRGAAPFYPIPSTIDRDKLTIIANFVYSPSFASRKTD